MVNFTKVFFVQGYSKDYGLFKEHLNVSGKIFQSGVVTLFLDDVVKLTFVLQPLDMYLFGVVSTGRERLIRTWLIRSST